MRPEPRRAEEKRREQKKKNDSAAVSGEEIDEGFPSFDVELVQVPGRRLSTSSKFERLCLTRRDFVMFFAGVGTTVLAILVGWALAALLR